MPVAVDEKTASSVAETPKETWVYGQQPPPFHPMEDLRTIWREWRKIVAWQKAKREGSLHL